MALGGTTGLSYRMMLQPNRPLLEKANSLEGIPKAFRPNPLLPEEKEFYSEEIEQRRAKHLYRKLKDDLKQSAQLGFFFKGVLYGNRGTGKSTELNRLTADPDLAPYLIVRLDAIDQLNPQTFSVVDVLSLIAISIFEACEAACLKQGRRNDAATKMGQDLQDTLAPYFPELQGAEQRDRTLGGLGELNLLQTVKLQIRLEGQTKTDVVPQRENLANLSGLLGRLIRLAQDTLGEMEILVVGENFDKEQIPRKLLEDTFVQYATVMRSLPVHLLFTLPVPFVYSYSERLPFHRENRYAIYDVPVFDKQHRLDAAGRDALLDVIARRAETGKVFENDALHLLLCGSGGDLFLLFAMIVKAGQLARYRYQDQVGTPSKVTLAEAKLVVQEQLSIFRNELGTAPGDADPTDWETKRKKLEAIYRDEPGADIPDPALYQLLRRRAVLFCNGVGRYGVHPMAVEVLREQSRDGGKFQAGGLGLDS